MIKSSKSFLRHCRSFWRLPLLAVIFAAVLSGAAIANEKPNLNESIQSLRLLLLKQIEYSQSIVKLAEQQKMTLNEYEKLLEEQRKISQDLEQRINDLKEQLTSSLGSAQSLSLELQKLRILHDRLEKQLELASRSSIAFRQEAKKQIEDIKRERNRAKKWLRWTIPGIGLAFLLGGLLGALAS